jgi:hypothetical protein
VELHRPKHWWIADVHFWIDAVDIVWVPDVVWKEETDELSIGMAFWPYCCWGWRQDLICGFVTPFWMPLLYYVVLRDVLLPASIGAVSLSLPRTTNWPDLPISAIPFALSLWLVEVTHHIQRDMDLHLVCIRMSNKVSRSELSSKVLPQIFILL